MMLFAKAKEMAQPVLTEENRLILLRQLQEKISRVDELVAEAQEIGTRLGLAVYIGGKTYQPGAQPNANGAIVDTIDVDDDYEDSDDYSDSDTDED
jgi:hypothetical protein